MEQVEEGEKRATLESKKVLRLDGKALENEDAKRFEKELAVVSWKWCGICKVCFLPAQLVI